MDLIKRLEKVREKSWSEIPNDLDVSFAHLKEQDLKISYDILVDNYKHLIKYGRLQSEPILVYWFPIYFKYDCYVVKVYYVNLDPINGDPDRRYMYINFNKETYYIGGKW